MKGQKFLFCLLITLSFASCFGMLQSSSSDDGEDGCASDDLDCLLENLEFLAGNKNPDVSVDQNGDEQYTISDTAYDGNSFSFSCDSGYLIGSVESSYQSDECSETYANCSVVADCTMSQTCGGGQIISSDSCGYDPCPGYDKYLEYTITCIKLDPTDLPVTGDDDDDSADDGNETIENLVSETIDTIYGDISDLPNSNSDSNQAPQITNATSDISLTLDYVNLLEIEYEDPFGCQPSFGVRLCNRHCTGGSCCSSRTKFTPPIPDHMIYGNWRTYTYLAEQVNDTAEVVMEVFPISIEGCDYYELEALGEIMEGEPDRLAVGEPWEIELTIDYIYYPPDEAWFDYCGDYDNFLECVETIGDEYYFGDDDDDSDDDDDYSGPGTVTDEQCMLSVSCEVCSIDACTRAVVSSSICEVEAWYETSDGGIYSCGNLSCSDAASMNEYCFDAAQASVNHCCPPPE